MIKITDTQVFGWEAAIRGMRAPMNSWDKSDSFWQCVDYDSLNENDIYEYEIGPNDLGLMKRLCKAGTDHRKFMRMLVVYVDICAPIYWLAELDTYKIGTVRNSCSFMHKGVSKPFKITDFSMKNEKIYEILSDYDTVKPELTYPYETDEYRLYRAPNGRDYKVYRNGKVIRCAFEYTDNYGTGRTRKFDESPATIYQNKQGYFIVKLSGRDQPSIPLHRLIAIMWLDGGSPEMTVDHINGDKGNNSVENLQWMKREDNIKKAYNDGAYGNLSSLRRKYFTWKNSCVAITPENRPMFRNDIHNGMSLNDLALKYGISKTSVNNVKWGMKHSEMEDLFQEAYTWERLLACLNSLRDLYLETKDIKIFQQIRCLLPQGYLQKATFMFNYEVLANIYKSRKDHKLDEWREFCDWIRGLPNSELITGED